MTLAAPRWLLKSSGHYKHGRYLYARVLLNGPRLHLNPKINVRTSTTKRSEICHGAELAKHHNELCDTFHETTSAARTRPDKYRLTSWSHEVEA